MLNLTGQQLGNYRLVRQLGSGGFGDVYLGTHIHLQREAAIKLLLKLDEPEIARFRSEAQIIARLTHPHIITLFDYDVAGEMPFIVMMYAPQGTMRTRYGSGIRVPLAEVVRYINQAASGLQFAHDQRVLHRDIKPANMLLGSDGQLLLSDFGLALMWSGTRSFHTQQVIGTHGYMAPEQFQGRPRPESDQYSLAITAYEWLYGSRPMADAPLGLGMLQLAHPELDIPPVSQMLPHLPSKIDEVLKRALSRDWQDRFSSVREFAETLTSAASTSGTTVSATQLASAPQGALAQTLPSTRPTSSPVHAQSDATLPPIAATLPAQTWSTPSHSIAPPPPSYAFDSETPPPPLEVHLMVLPVTRRKNGHATRFWTIGYTAFLLALGAALVALTATYRAGITAPTWIIVSTLVNIMLLIMFATVLCGALLGKWRALLVSTFSLGLTFLSVYLVLSYTFSSSLGDPGSSWTGAFGYSVLPISTFVVGWIYERRQHTHFGKSYLSMSAGLALLIILPLITTSLIQSSPQSSYTSIGSTIGGSMFIIGCLGILLVFPLALVATGLEALMHILVKWVQGAPEHSKPGIPPV